MRSVIALRVVHLLERLFAGVFGQFGEPPVVLHLGVQEVLVDGRQLAGELLVEQLQNIWIALHGISSLDTVRWHAETRKTARDMG